MNKLVVSLLLGAGALVASTVSAPTSQAAKFSSTKVEILYGFGYERRNEDAAILTIANASGFTWGDSYFFVDAVNIDDTDKTDGMHLEFGPRFSLLRAFGNGPRKTGALKDLYAIVQLDLDGNAFTQKLTTMAGISADWNVPGFRFFKTHLQFRNDPTKDGNSTQVNLVWNKGFGDGKFSFEGFLDWTSSEGNGSSNLLVQPQLVYHPNKHVAFGIEYQYWQNRLGIKGLDESAPQIMFRWTF